MRMNTTGIVIFPPWKWLCAMLNLTLNLTSTFVKSLLALICF